MHYTYVAVAYRPLRNNSNPISSNYFQITTQSFILGSNSNIKGRLKMETYYRGRSRVIAIIDIVGHNSSTFSQPAFTCTPYNICRSLTTSYDDDKCQLQNFKSSSTARPTLFDFIKRESKEKVGTLGASFRNHPALAFQIPIQCSLILML
jgi:hypothetical protein